MPVKLGRYAVDWSGGVGNPLLFLSGRARARNGRATAIGTGAIGTDSSGDGEWRRAADRAGTGSGDGGPDMGPAGVDG